MRRKGQPPALAEWVISAVTRRADRPYVLSDLLEEFDEVRGRLGPRRARRWYWTEPFSRAT